MKSTQYWLWVKFKKIEDKNVKKKKIRQHKCLSQGYKYFAQNKHLSMMSKIYLIIT
jgi:hypothetical protein